MTYEEIIAKSNEFLVDEFEVDGSKITPQANLRETLELDSLDYMMPNSFISLLKIKYLNPEITGKKKLYIPYQQARDFQKIYCY